MHSVIYLNNRPVGHDHPVFIVAEIGINHNGSVDIAKQLIDVAILSGCDAVKFQKRTVPAVYSPAELEKPREVPPEILRSAVRRNVLPPEAVSRLEKSNFTESTNGDLKFALEFSQAEYEEIDQYCKNRGILWFASPWDEASVDFLEQFDPPCHKIASPSLTDRELLRHIARKGRPIILSTGMSTMDMVRKAVEEINSPNLILLHCTSTYPCKLEEINLSVIAMLKNEFPGIPIGFSGHEVGLPATFAAAVMGACVIERHVTLDRAMWGSDQAASVEPNGMIRLVREIRAFERARGDGVNRIYESEVPIAKKLRRKNTL
jgi:N-acetylneuraminate synthase